MGTTAIVFALLTTSAYATEQPKTDTVTNTELQKEVDTLRIWVQTLQDQRNAILDQLAAAQVQLRQVQVKK